MKHYLLNGFLVITIGLSQCRNESCYKLDVQFDKNARIRAEDPVFYGDGLIGYIKHMEEGDPYLIAMLCIFDSVRIPSNASIQAGYIPAFGNYGISVLRGDSTHFAKPGDLLQGSIKDTLDFSFSSPVDSALIEKTIEVLKTLNEKKD